ncbi:MAG: Gmad2 immunoglobulin-like domain-containing protein [Chloroflexi bacterium]|nr:Gmad2 immunoglobulin-like domain-containing protein [Chloroflexota bacterium]MCI0580241.1 Gmad2 immunoglobulin-like domain-containing protein [Chloroflexota bacterium]MCI0646898.1 Gmad2 immunoglobulin-like domain-containing protein [Chloroflexota bacterium]MCI0729097.1 Gmad2 immunoglobulin-like domain-containing protein [Chloroflexota bacterium]
MKTLSLLLYFCFVMMLALAGCSAEPTPTPPPTVGVPTLPPVQPGPTDTPVAIPTSPVNATQPAGPTTAPAPGVTIEEAILILEPGPGSRVTSPIRVAGMADSTFEQALAVRLVTADGQEITTVPAQITSELGTRGPFAVEVPFNVGSEQPAFIQVFAASARDGGITHLASVAVTLSPGGPASIIPVSPFPERIVISQPALVSTISGGLAHVEGIALASFEQTLVVEVLDTDGNVVGSQAIIVAAPDLGQPGPFIADVPYTIAVAGPGRIVVRDPSPAFGGDVHLASVEVTLEP